MTRAIVKYNQGDPNNTVAFIFACPGQVELKDNKVLAGTTGDNLNLLLKELNSLCRKTFFSIGRYSYLLTNASEQVYYRGYINNRTLPLLNDDVYRTANLKRLISELDTKKIIIAFGKHAKKAVKKIKCQLNQCICVGAKCHLGMQGINHITNNIHDQQIPKNSLNATQQRLKVIAYDIWDKIQKGGNL